MKDNQIEQPNGFNSQRFDNTETFQREKKKKKRWQQKKDSNTPATSFNILEPTRNEKNGGTLKKQKQGFIKDLSRII